MNREELTALLQKLHAELAARPQVDAATREALQTLDADIQRVLAQSSEQAANDPQATSGDQGDINALAQTLEAKLETDHPVLVGTLRDALARKNSITLFGPENSAGIVSFAMAGVHPHDIGTILDESGVAIRAGHHCAQPLMEHLGVPATARASFGVYSNDDDVAALIDGLARVERIFG